MTGSQPPNGTSAARIEALRQQRTKLLARVQAMLATPQDQRPSGRPALRGWLTELEDSQRMLEQFDKVLKTLAPKPSTKAIPRKRAAQVSADEDDSLVLGRIPKGRNSEVRVIAKTWNGCRVVDVRLWSVSKGATAFGPTRLGVTVEARMLSALVEALQLAQKHA